MSASAAWRGGFRDDSFFRVFGFNPLQTPDNAQHYLGEWLNKFDKNNNGASFQAFLSDPYMVIISIYSWLDFWGLLQKESGRLVLREGAVSVRITTVLKIA